MTQRQYTRRTPSQWQEHVTNQASSGLSISAYCQQQGLAVSNFYHWRKKLSSVEFQLTNKKETAAPNDSWAMLGPSMMDTSIPACHHTDITLALPGGIELTIRAR